MHDLDKKMDFQVSTGENGIKNSFSAFLIGFFIFPIQQNENK